MKNHTDEVDNWWDAHHKSENLLVHFSDKELQNELDRRQFERRKIEIVKISNGREAVAYYTIVGGDERHTEWELNVVYNDANKFCFTFSSREKQSEETMVEFKETYFPNLPRYSYEDYKRFKASKSKIKNAKTNNNRISSSR